MARQKRDKEKNRVSLRDLMSSASPRYTEVSIRKARKLAGQILEDPNYQHNLLRRAVAGVLSPAVECMLWYYVFGKPAENINLNTERADLSKLTGSELAERAAEVAILAREAAKIQDEQNEREEQDIEPEMLN